MYMHIGREDDETMRGLTLIRLLLEDHHPPPYLLLAEALGSPSMIESDDADDVVLL